MSSLTSQRINASTHTKSSEFTTPTHSQIISSDSDHEEEEQVGRMNSTAAPAPATHSHAISGVYLTRHAKKALLEYKYHSVDDSFASYHMQPFWEWCVKLLPMWMAPNLVTLIGFIAISLNMAILLILAAPHDLNTDLPRWAYFMTAIATFAYQTLDAIDGKQARRTGASSPLGEMMDHGIDAATTLFHAISVLICIRFGSGWHTYLFVVMTFFAAYFCIWENYYTDEMRFGYWNSPTEALLLSIAALAVHGVLGTAEFWTWNALDLLPGVLRSTLRNVLTSSSSSFATKVYLFLDKMTLNQVFFLAGAFVAASSALPSALTVLRSAESNTRRGKLSGAIVAVLPYFILTFVFTGFLYYTPEQDALLTRHIVGVLFAYGLACSYIQTRLVVARICDEKAILFPFIFYPLPFMFLHQWLHWDLIGSAHLLYAYLMYVVVVYVHFSVFSVHEICEHLGIQAFRLDYLKKRQAAVKKTGSQ